MDELRMVNPKIVKKFGLGSLDQLQQKMSSVMSMEHMMLKYSNSMTSFNMPIFGHPLSIQEM